MTMQSGHHQHQSFVHTAGGQITLLVAAIIVVMAIAWLFVW